MTHLVLALGLCLIGCSGHMHPYADFLEQSVGREDRVAVAKKMGDPQKTVKRDNGGDLWTYEYCPNGSSQCQHLHLIFDESGTLSEWFEN